MKRRLFHLYAPQCHARLSRTRTAGTDSWAFLFFLMMA